MAPSTPPDPGPEDVLSMGEERSPRWRLLGLLLAVLALSVGGWQLVSRPAAPAAPGAAAASDGSRQVLASDGLPRLRPDRTEAGPSVRLGARTVALTGPGTAQAHRETAAEVLGRIGRVWVVEVTSRACEGRPDTQVSYGTARASGRFSVWDPSETRRGARWSSPDGTLLLLDTGSRLEVRRPGSHRVVRVFPGSD